MNILYHHRTQGRGAEGVHITSIVNALVAMGHTVKIISPAGVDPMANAGNAPVDKSNIDTTGINSVWKYISKKFPNFLFELAEIFYNLVAMRALEKELNENDYDAIYERYAFFMIAGVIKAKKYEIPLILEANEVSGIQDRARKQTFKSLCDRFERYLFKRCHSIHTVSSYLKNMIIEQGVKEFRIKVAPNAIDPRKFRGQRESGNLVNKYNLHNQVVLGFAGWFDNWDRLDLLMETFAKLTNKHDNLTLLLIGDGDVLQVTRKQVLNYNLSESVILTGAVNREQVQEYISLLDIAVITHSNEFGSPVVMFEFMGLRIPIVAPKLLPITDVLQDNESALLFDTLNMAQLEEKLEQLIVKPDLRVKLANLAYEQLMLRHTWESNAREIIEDIKPDD